MYRGAVYRCSVKSGKSQKVSRGGFDTVKGAVGKYVYAGVDQGEDGIRLYAVNAKTKRAKFMAAGVGGVQCAGKRVMTTPSYGVLGNYPICTFKKDGSGKRKIGTGFAGKLTKKHAYYVQYSYAKSKYRAFRCNPDGTKKKAVTKWVASRSEVAKYQR